MRMEVVMPKESLNLSIDGSVVSRARRYSHRHGTSISSLVSGFLSSLPADEQSDGGEELPPVVRRLYGVARGGGDLDDYRRRLVEKYER
jgi:hypothetical protein